MAAVAIVINHKKRDITAADWLIFAKFVTIIQNGPSAIVDLGNWIFYCQAVKTPILHNDAKFRKDRSNCWGDIAIFMIFKFAAAAILVF